MVQCASCKNRTSLDQCPSQTIKGLLFCGKHAKTKIKRLWAEENNGKKHATIVQKLWRGYFLRKRLKMAGEGVLNRKDCHNTEELVTLDDKTKVYPLNYFSFREADKLWWFDVRSLYTILKQSQIPVNPYTRQPLTIETRRRLRDVCRIRKKLELPIYHDTPLPESFSHLVNEKWLTVCQIIEENGFFDMNHLLFASLNRSQLYVFMNLIHQDLISFASEHTTSGSRRSQYVHWAKSHISNFSNRRISRTQASWSTSRVLLSILYDCPENYTVCFIIISAICRM
jgi:hypothetical protein